MYDFFTNLFRLTRPLSNAKSIAIIVLAFYLSKSQFDWLLLVMGSLSLSLIFSGLYSYNSLCDRVLDPYNENKRQYAKALDYFGVRNSLFIAIGLALGGLVVGLLINTNFFVSILLLLVVGFLYSSPYTRLKEKVVWDVVFGASLTFLLRFVAAWFIFSQSFPPILPMLALVFLKNGGYMLYKGYDRPFLQQRGIKNSITRLSESSLAAVSLLFFILSILLFVVMCLNSSLPFEFLFLLVFFIPPIIIQYLLFFKKISIQAKYIRSLGFIFLLALMITALFLL